MKLRFQDWCLWVCMFGLLGMQAYHMHQHEKYAASQTQWYHEQGEKIDEYGRIIDKLWDLWGK